MLRSLVVLTGLSACVGKYAPPLVPPESGGAAWTEVTTMHFTVRSDRAAHEVQDTAEQLERSYMLLADVAFPFVTKPGGRTSVLVLRDREEFKLLTGMQHAAGFFMPRVWDPGDPTVFMYGETTLERLGVVKHELAHRFIQFYFPGAPAWIHEGVAQYYSTIVAEDGRVVLGREPPTLLLRPGMTWDYKASAAYGVITYVPTGVLPTARELLDSDPSDFHVMVAERGLVGEDSRRVLANYAGSWALVHVLKNSDEDLARRFDAFMLALGRGEDVRKAWRDGFPALTDGALDERLRAFYARRETTLLRAPYEPREPEIVGVRTMSPLEVHLLWAAVRPWTAEGLTKAKVDIGAALTISPTSVDARLWQARLALAEKDPAKAERLLREILAERPDEERCLKQLFSLVTAAVDAAPSPDNLARADALVPALQKAATQAGSFNDLAWYLAHRKRLDEALPLALRAVSVDFACFECFDTLAYVLHEQGSLAQADAMQTIAVNLVPHGSADAEMLARQRQYRADAQRGKPAG